MSAIVKFDMELYMRIRRERICHGLKVYDINQFIPNHPFIGRRIVSNQTHEMFTVQGVTKNYSGGWYLSIIIALGQKIYLIPWMNINCVQNEILFNIKNVHERFTFIED